MGRVKAKEALTPRAVKCGRLIVATVNNDMTSGDIGVTGERALTPFTFWGTQEYNRLSYFYSVKVTVRGGSRFGRWLVYLTVWYLLSRQDMGPVAYAPLLDERARYTSSIIAWSKPLARDVS